LAERREQLNGVSPRRAWDEASIAARKRAFLLLWKHRMSLRAERRHHGHLKSRYEALFLITLLARLERDLLTQPLPASREPQRPTASDDQRLELGVAAWAQPWGVAFLTALNSDLYHLEEAVNRLGKWLPPRPRLAAERSARERLERIEAEVVEGSARAPAVEAPGERATEKERGSAAPSATKVASIAAALVATAGAVAGLVFVASNAGNVGHPPSVPRRTEAPRPPVTVPPLEAQARQGREPRGAGHQAPGKGAQPNEAGRSATPATVQEAPQSVPVSAEVSAPAPAPAAEPAPSPAPQPVSSPPNPAPSQEQSSASQQGGGCPPEFGYEC
jgi:hypothetical protein